MILKLLCRLKIWAVNPLTGTHIQTAKRKKTCSVALTAWQVSIRQMLSFPVDGAHQHVQVWTALAFIADKSELQIFVHFWHCRSAVVWCCLGPVSGASHQWHCASLFARFARWAWGFREVLLCFHCKKNSSLFCRTNSSYMGKCDLLRQQLIGMNWTKLRKTAAYLPFVLVVSCKGLTVFLSFSVFSQCYSAHAAYCQSKLAQLLFSSHFHQELQRGGFPLSSCAVDPGMVDTALYRHLWPPLCLAQSAIARLLFRVKHCPDFHLLYAHRGQVWIMSSCKTAKQIWYKYWTTLDNYPWKIKLFSLNIFQHTM